jgi:hypothetical protein
MGGGSPSFVTFFYIGMRETLTQAPAKGEFCDQFRTASSRL